MLGKEGVNYDLADPNERCSTSLESDHHQNGEVDFIDSVFLNIIHSLTGDIMRL